MKWFRSAAIGTIAVAALATVAYSAGLFPGFPIVGGSAYCTSVSGIGNTAGTGQPSITGTPGQFGQGFPNQGGSTGNFASNCNVVAPAGPATTTGQELIPADTGLPNGQQPQTVLIPNSYLGPLNLKINRVVGGDFGTNLWQRGTTPVSAASPTTAVMSADRFWAISASNVITITKQTPASTAADYLGASGFYSWMRVARPSGTPSGVTCVGQTLDQQQAAELIGKNAVLSFYGYAPTTYSATNQNVTVTIAYFTAGDAVVGQTAIGAAGVNSKTFALSASGQAGGIAGYTAVTAGSSPSFPASTVASNVATVGLTQSPVRYSFYGFVPALTAAGTQVTSVGIAICGTPTLTTTVSTDYFEITGVQLQGENATATVALPTGLIAPTGFERRPASIDQLNQLYYSYVVNEGALGPSRSVCHFTTANTAMQCPISFPVPMRLAPAMVYATGFAGFTTTAETTANACTGNTTDATVALASSPNQVMMQCAIASGTTAAVGLSMTLIDNAGTGKISASAEP